MGHPDLEVQFERPDLFRRVKLVGVEELRALERQRFDALRNRLVAEHDRRERRRRLIEDAFGWFCIGAVSLLFGYSVLRWIIG